MLERVRLAEKRTPREEKNELVTVRLARERPQKSLYVAERPLTLLILTATQSFCTLKQVENRFLKGDFIEHYIQRFE
ncbi:hypothetical protein V1502_05150 [Bacillus sp. SCS-153A]|uniref:hypothetical protein n=1 Tax=Rossellomorea sedimentorum TaxID=3115294 RepID=UPI0039062DEB